MKELKGQLSLNSSSVSCLHGKNEQPHNFMLWSRRIPQAKPDWAGSIAGVTIPRESHVPQVVLAELSALLPSTGQECARQC